MALYAFDGTWNSAEDEPKDATNVVRFTELYVGNNTEYVAGVGTHFGKLGHVLGGLFGSGGRTRISDMYDELCDNWSGVRLMKGASYTFTVADGDTWKDADINCGPGGWKSDELPWYKEGFVQFAEQYRRLPGANWFALAGALGDEDDELFLIGNNKEPFTVQRNANLYLFANDIPSKYDNNEGSLAVKIVRTA